MREKDSGTISMFTVLFTLVVMILGGLVVDGGTAIHARERAYDIAEQAARAGANDIDQDALRQTGKTEINTGTACGKAGDLVTYYGGQVTGFNCDPGLNQVTVTIRINVQTKLLGLIGFTTFTMQGQASAHPDTGNT
jgi:Flp pilus assembly protein TadG